MTAPALEILRCAACDAPIPLGDGDEATCPFCKAVTKIPDAQRTLRDAGRADTETRRRAAELAATIGRPPRLALRLVGFVSPSFLVLGGAVLVLLAAFWLFYRVGGAIGRSVFSTQLADVVSDKLMIVAPIALAFVLGLVGLVLGAYARRKAISVRALQAGLAARPPERAGGPATCRLCGAPLTVPVGSLGVRCDHCAADNLVQVPAAWIRALEAGRAKLASAFEVAADAQRAELARLRGRLRARLIGWAIVAVVFGGIFALGLSMEDPFANLVDWPPSWSKDVHAPDRALHGHRTRVTGDDVPIHPDKVAIDRCHDAWLDSNMGAWATDGACDAAGCRFRWIVALRHGERLTFHTTELAATLRFYVHDPDEGFDDGDFRRIATAAVDANTPAVFEASLSAWYAVGVTIAGMRPNEGRSLCIELAH